MNKTTAIIVGTVVGLTLPVQLTFADPTVRHATPR